MTDTRDSSFYYDLGYSMVEMSGVSPVGVVNYTFIGWWIYHNGFAGGGSE